MQKKIITFLLLISLFLINCSYSCAESVQPRYSHVFSVSSGVELNGSTLWCFGEGDSMFNYTYTYLYVRLLRLPEDGGNWSPVTSWSTSSVGYVPSTIEETVTVSPGYSYRVYVNVQIKDETGYILDSVGMYSNIVTYPSTTTTP